MKKKLEKIVACFLAVVLLTLNVVEIYASVSGEQDECLAGGDHDWCAVDGNSLPGATCSSCGQEGWMWQQWYECSKCYERKDIAYCGYCGWEG